MRSLNLVFAGLVFLSISNVAHSDEYDQALDKIKGLMAEEPNENEADAKISNISIKAKKAIPGDRIEFSFDVDKPSKVEAYYVRVGNTQVAGSKTITTEKFAGSFVVPEFSNSKTPVVSLVFGIKNKTPGKLSILKVFTAGKDFVGPVISGVTADTRVVKVQNLKTWIKDGFLVASYQLLPEHNVTSVMIYAEKNDKILSSNICEKTQCELKVPANENIRNIKWFLTVSDTSGSIEGMKRHPLHPEGK